jgi:NAD(P)-dependent dehydrogenase (short-subunit alcohol dehydrogenase family)
MEQKANPFSLAGKTSMVTGGSRGLGLGMAEGLARAGSRVILVSRSPEPLEAAAAGLAEQTGARVAALPWDVSRIDSLAALVEHAAAVFGGLDILVNNAGAQVRKPFLEVTPDEYDQVLDTNLKAVYFLGQQAARHMVAHRVAGRIINVASLTSRLGIRNTSAYGASKGGVYSLTKNMAVELAPYGIRVCAVAPGYFRTQLTEAAFQDTERLAWMQSRIPLGGTGSPRDLAGTVVFLASPAADYLTGNVIFVDGGWTSA